MISFEPSEEQRLAQAAMQEFAQSELRPRAQRADSQSTIDQETLDALWETGIVQAQVLDDGAGRSMLMNALVLEELAAGDLSLALAIAAPLAYAQALLDQGTPAQKSTLLPQIAGAGFRRAAIATMERVFGSHPGELQTRARRDGDDWLIDGCKVLVPFGEKCEDALVLAAAPDRVRAFMVPTATPGVRLERTNGTLGLRALELGNLHLDQVRVPAERELGGPEGCDVERLLASSRAALAAMFVGLGRAVLDHTVQYVKDRVVHGTALARKQVIAFRVADMHIDVNAMRWMAWQAAWSLETGTDWKRLCTLAHVFSAEKVLSIADEGVQAFGGHGFVKAEPIEMWYRNAAAAAQVSGLAGV